MYVGYPRISQKANCPDIYKKAVQKDNANIANS